MLSYPTISKKLFANVDELKSGYKRHLNANGKLLTLDQFIVSRVNTHGKPVVSALKNSAVLTSRTNAPDVENVKKLVVLLYNLKKTNSQKIEETRNKVTQDEFLAQIGLTTEELKQSKIEVQSTAKITSGLLAKMIQAGITSRSEKIVTDLDLNDDELALLEAISNATIQSI